MYFKPFATKEKVLAHISAGKPASCQDRLESHFMQALGDGLDHNQAGEKALLVHAHLDHGEGIDFNVATDFPFSTAEEIHQAYAEALMPLNQDGRAEERVDLVVETFNRFYSWGLSLAYAADIAWLYSAEKWTVENVADADLN